MKTHLWRPVCSLSCPVWFFTRTVRAARCERATLNVHWRTSTPGTRPFYGTRPPNVRTILPSGWPATNWADLPATPPWPESAIRIDPVRSTGTKGLHRPSSSLTKLDTCKSNSWPKRNLKKIGSPLADSWSHGEVPTRNGHDCGLWSRPTKIKFVHFED